MSHQVFSIQTRLNSTEYDALLVAISEAVKISEKELKSFFSARPKEVIKNDLHTKITTSHKLQQFYQNSLATLVLSEGEYATIFWAVIDRERYLTEIIKGPFPDQQLQSTKLEFQELNKAWTKLDQAMSLAKKAV